MHAPRRRGQRALALTVLATALAAQAAPLRATQVDDAERLHGLGLRYAALAGPTGPEDPAVLAGEFVFLLQELEEFDRDSLPMPQRVDYDVLNWRLSLGIVEQMEPELSDYELALLRHTGERQNPETLHQLGLDEVERLRTEMEALVQEYDSEADLGAFLDAARDDPRLYADSRDELVAHARRTAATIRQHLDALFHDIPETPFQIVTPGDRRSPRYMAWYQGPGRGRDARGFVVLNPDPRQVPLFVLDALIVHEAMPGHHFQMAWTAEAVDVPRWRRDIMLTVFVEGWGLYAERLGEELGVYRHPMSEFGRLNLEMWRAIRLVVDTGLHEFGWSDERAINFFAEHTALPRAQIEVEVARYARNPGQAVAYKLGEQRLLAIRAYAEASLGPAFDIRDFHRAVLEHGPVPMSTLEEIVAAWIRDQQTVPDL